METDKRVKLTPEQKAEILAIPLKEGHFKGYTQIAKKYGVHKRTIEFLFSPHKLIENRERAKIRNLKNSDKK